MSIDLWAQDFVAALTRIANALEQMVEIEQADREPDEEEDD